MSDHTLLPTQFQPSSEQLPPLPLRGALNHRSRTSNLPRTHSPRMVIVLLCISIFIMVFGVFLIMMPGTRIFEDIICHHYFNDIKGEGGVGVNEYIDEKLCKVDAVQEELAILMGGLGLSNAIPGVFLAFPYGLLADRIGRKPVFALAVTGIILSTIFMIVVGWFWQIFPFRLLWLAPIFKFIGGGDAVSGAMVLAIISDVTTDETRTNAFFASGVAALVAQVIAPLIASVLMRRSPWIPVLFGTAIVGIGAACIVFVPETLHYNSTHNTNDLEMPNSQPSLAFPAPKVDNTSYITTVRSHIRLQFHRLYTATSILHSIPVFLLLTAFLIKPIIEQSIELSLRFISKRFSWSLADATILLTMLASLNILLLAAILPLLSDLLTRTSTTSSTASRLERLRRFGFSLSPRQKDLVLARLSIVFLTIGVAFIAYSPTAYFTIAGLAISALGTGFLAFCRSLITTLVDQQHVARLYALISVVETAGLLVSGPLLAVLYNLGIKWQGAWVGLPFWLICACCIMSAVGIWVLRLPPAITNDERGDVDAEYVALLAEPDTPVTGNVHPVYVE